MREFELAMKAASDPTRTRILKLLEGGGLCVCQVQAVLGLAPSTVSRHLAILKLAGLVDDRRNGKWIEYALTPASHNPHAGRVLALLESLDREAAVLADRRRLRAIRAIPLVELCSLPPEKVPVPARMVRHRGMRKERSRA
jgi:ArsR family transcriptional regulator